MIQVGSKAPEIALTASSGETVRLEDFAGQWIVLYFYPRDNTPGCTLEAQQFSQLADEFDKRHAVVLGVSTDTVQSHCAFIEKHDLRVRLLSDPHHQVTQTYGAWREKVRGAARTMGTVRCTYLIDRRRMVVDTWDSVKANGHARQVLESIDNH